MAVSKFKIARSVFINGVLRTDARVVSVVRTIGDVAQTATVEIFPVADSPATGRFHNTNVQTLFANQTLEIVVVVGVTNYTYHVGRIVGGRIAYDGENEFYVLESRVDSHMFGEPLITVNNAARPLSSDLNLSNWRKETGIEDNLVFNPVFDGRRQGNRFFVVHESSNQWMFIHPDSVPLFSNGRYNEFWTIRTAIQYLCESLNYSETYIQNPSTSDFDVLPDVPSDITAIKIPRGTFLPEAMEKVLDPFGYVATLGMPNSINGETKPWIKFLKRNGNTAIIIKGQVKGANFDINSNQANSVDISVDSAKESFSGVHIVSARGTLEITAELVPGWRSEYDEQYRELKDLLLESEWARYNVDGERTWRDWVLNENNDYQAIRDYLTAWEHPVWKDFAIYLPRRRKLLPVLSQFADGSPVGIHGGIFVEYSIDGGNEWFSVTGSETDAVGTGGSSNPTQVRRSRRGLTNPSLRILNKEAGIRFTGTYPPRELLAAGLDAGGRPKAKIRVTACIEGDRRIIPNKKTTNHILTDERLLVLDMSNRMRSDAIHYSSIFKPRVDGGNGYASREVDNTDDVSAIGDLLIDNWGHITTVGSIELFGEAGHFFVDAFDTSYEVSEVLGSDVLKVDGRELRFDADPGGSKFPTIESIEHDFIESKTILRFRTYRGK